MKFNDIIDCFNVSIEGERIIKDLHIYGHLVYVMEIKKSIGPYKQSYIYINYVNRDTGENHRLVTSELTDRADTKSMDAFILKSEKQALLKLIVTLQDKQIWEAIVNGTYKNGIE